MDPVNAQGMVAVVRGMKDAGLAVTLLENGRQYTLAPNTHTTPMQAGTNPTTMPLYMPGHMNGNMSGHMPGSMPGVMPGNMPISMPIMPQHLPGHGLGMNQDRQSGSFLRSVATNAELNDRICSGTQAVDGRYASVYQTTLCKMKPTSPPVELTEFPPQRASRVPGHDNFVVGGTGSGDTSYTPVRIPNSYRGGMVWTNRGSVFTPRPSKQPDAFENSLRKYPRVSPDRSSEIVERLITYSQAKNYGRNPKCSNSNSQTRNFEFEGEVYNARSPTRIAKGCDTSSKINESPIKERTKLDRNYLDNRRLYGRVYDVRHLRDASKALKDQAKNLLGSNYSYQSSFRDRRERERCDSPEFRKMSPEVPSMVNSEIQAAATMVCREVSTTPGQSMRNVAATAEVEQATEGAVFPIQRSVQTVNSLRTVRKFVTTTLSNIDIPSACFTPTLRKTKSEENFTNKRDMQLEILEKLDRIFVIQETQAAFRHSQKSVERDSSNNSSNKAKIVPIWYKNCDKRCHGIKKDLISNISFETGFNVYRAEVIPLATMTEQEREIITAWLHDIPLKRKDFLGRAIKREQILSYVICRISMIPTTVKIDKKRFRAEILDIVDDVPIDVASKNKYIYENKLVEDLISKLESEKIRTLYGDRKFRWNHGKIVYTASTGCGYRKVNEPLEIKLREFVKQQLEDAIRTSQLDLDISKAPNVETDLVDILTDYLDDIKDGKETEAKEEIATLLRDTKQILNNQATNFASLLLMDFKKILDDLIQECDEKPPVQNLAVNNSNEAKDNCINMLVEPLIKKYQEFDLIKENEIMYVQNLENKIAKWLSCTVKENFAEKNPTIFNAIVKDLAKDIVDRHKYSELNPSRQVSERDEIEHLKYQIFKWVYVFEGEDNVVNLEKASDLMNVIKTVPKPVLIRPKNDTERPHQSAVRFLDSTEEKPPTILYQRVPIRLEDFSVWPSIQGTWGPQLFSIMPVQEGNLNDVPEPVQQINDEFDDFLKQWVQSVPIDGEQMLVEKIRLGLLHGVWKAIAKVKTLPGVLTNPFYYQDALDDEIEQLFTLLPPTQELASKKHLAKVQLMEKVTQVNDRIKAIYVPQTFEQQLVKGMTVYIPKTETSTRGEDSAQLFEDLQMLNLADEYIMFIRYREEDPIKANVYKTKLLKRTQEFVEQLKKQHEKELKDIDPDMYMNDILAAIQQVPLPSEDTIEKEADIVMLGIEIDKWLADLPLHPINDRYEMLKRRRLRNALANRIYELEKSIDLTDSSAEQKLKHEVSLVLEKLPLEKDESLKINTMVDQLANRIRNRQRSKEMEYSCKEACKGSCKDIPGKSRLLQSGRGASFSQQTGAQSQPNISPAPKAQKVGEDGRVWYAFDDERRPSSGPGAAIIPPSAISPPPTDVMQDPSGRFWYAFDRRPAPMYQNQGQGAQVMPGPAAQGAQADGTFWLSQKLKDYEQAHPPVATPNTSVQFGPPKSKVIQDPSMFGAYQQMPPSSSFVQPNIQQGHALQQSFGGPQQSFGGPRQSFGGPQQSFGGPRQSFGGPQQSFGGPQQSMGAPQQSFGGPQQSMGAPQQSMGAPQQSFGGPRQSFGGPQQSMGAPQQSFGGPQQSIGEPQQSFGGPQQSFGGPEQSVGGSQQSSCGKKICQTAGGPMCRGRGQSFQYQQGASQVMPGPAAQGAQANAQADGTLWLSQKLKEYEEAHPPVATPNTSVQFGPPKSKVIQDPSMFGAYQQMPASSSFAEPNVPKCCVQKSPGGPQPSCCSPTDAKQRTVGSQAYSQHRPWPVVIDSHQSTQTGSSLQPGGTDPSQFISLNETNAPYGMWNNQPSGAQGSLPGQLARSGPGGVMIQSAPGSGAEVSGQQYSEAQGGISAGQQSMGQSQFASINQTQAPPGIWNSPQQAVSGRTDRSCDCPDFGQGTIPGASGAAQASMASPGSGGLRQNQFVSMDQSQAPPGMWTSQQQPLFGQPGQGPGIGQSSDMSPGANMSGGPGNFSAGGIAPYNMTMPNASMAGAQANMTGQGSFGSNQFASLDQTQAPPGMWAAQQQGPESSTTGTAGAGVGRQNLSGSAASGFCSKTCKKGAAAAGCPNVSGNVSPAADLPFDPVALQGANDTHGPMWLSKYMRDYEENRQNPQNTPYENFWQGGKQDAASSTPQSCLCKTQNPTGPCRCRVSVLETSQQNMTQQGVRRFSIPGQPGHTEMCPRVSAAMQTACTNMAPGSRRPTLLGAGTYILPAERPCNTRVIEVGCGPPGSKKSQKNQLKKNEDGSDDEPDNRCRCFQKFKRRKGRGMCHNFNLLDFACPYRYFPPPPCYY